MSRWGEATPLPTVNVGDAGRTPQTSGHPGPGSAFPNPVGLDAATSIIRSTDGGVSWQQGSPLAVVSLASVDHEVWATTHDGVMYSTDRGAINSSHLKVLTG